MNPVSVSAQVEILASPAAVRSVFLDFARYNEWQKGWDIKPADTGKKSSEIKTGDSLRVAMHGMAFNPIVLENSTECFAWEGSIPIILSGQHRFSFSPSKENPGGTTFIQSEEFRGALALYYWPQRNQKQLMHNWDAFNAALKKEVERSSSYI
ncbi:hypothetical protein BKA56DRAFT_610833 [Ilyonectria sp. MPI-CAGE-AT-0026]|nr:hypothetical protein BKA56DRAFT_610833 [Ilyonectria sp. MPI-CAGE-AT-0026]